MDGVVLFSYTVKSSLMLNTSEGVHVYFSISLQMLISAW